MSAMPQRTRVLIKDLLFQEKYKLNNTQVDIMYISLTLKLGL